MSERASGPLGSLKTTLGQKTLVALTGLALLGFVFAHMAGNLQIFLGQEALNAYAHKLKSLGPLLWVMRLGLLAMAAVHIVTALRLALASKSARPVAYSASGNVQKTVSSRSMAITGLAILAFVVFHLAHYTWGWVMTDAHALVDSLGQPDVFSMTVLGFQQPLIATAYVVAMILLALHLCHGTASVFQTLGLNAPHFSNCIARLSLGVAWLVLIGNAAMPLAVQFGLVTLPAGVGS